MEWHQQSTRTIWGFLLPFVFLVAGTMPGAHGGAAPRLSVIWMTEWRCVLTDYAWSQVVHKSSLCEAGLGPTPWVCDWSTDLQVDFCLQPPLAEGYSGVRVTYPVIPGCFVSRLGIWGFVDMERTFAGSSQDLGVSGEGQSCPVCLRYILFVLRSAWEAVTSDCHWEKLNVEENRLYINV